MLWPYDELSGSLSSDRVFMDVGIEPGVDFVSRIQEAIQAAEVVVVVVIRPDWVHDGAPDLLNLEIAAALDGDRRAILVLAGGARMPLASELPPALQPLVRRQAPELSDWRWKYDVARPLAGIEVATARRPAAPRSQNQSEPVCSAASDEVFERVLKTNAVNWVAIVVAGASLLVAALTLISYFTRRGRSRAATSALDPARCTA